MKKYLLVEVGTNVWGGVTTVESVLSFTRTLNYGDSIAGIELSVVGTNDNLTDVTEEKQIRIYHKDTSPVTNGDELFFKGFISKVSLNGSGIKIIADDWLVKTQWELGTVDSDSSTTVKSRITQLCTDAGIGSIDIDATATSPVNILKLHTTKFSVYNRLMYLMNLTGWFFYYNAPTDTTYFKPKSSVTKETYALNYTGKTTNLIKSPEWVSDSSNVVNDTTVVGGASSRTDTDTIDTTSIDHDFGSWDGWNLSAGSADIIIDSVTRTAGAAHTFNTNEYRLTESGGTPVIMFFEPNTPNTLGVTEIEVQFTWTTASNSNNQTNGSSDTTYGTRKKLINDRKILDITDLTAYATNFVSDAFWGDSEKTVMLQLNPSVTPTLGAMVDIFDGTNNDKTLLYASDNCIIVSIIEDWLNPSIRVKVSTKPIRDIYSASNISDKLEAGLKELTDVNPTNLFKIDGTTPASADINFNQNELINARLHNVATKNTAGYTGQIVFDTGDSKPYVYDGSNWVDMSGGGASDHGALTGLADDDHTQYLLATGTRNITGDIRITSSKSLELAGAAGDVIEMYANAGDFYIDNLTDAQGLMIIDGDTFKTTFVGSISVSDCEVADGSKLSLNGATATTYLIDDASGNMELHVAAGKKVEIVVG